MSRTEHWHERVKLFGKESTVPLKAKSVFLGNSLIEEFDLEKFFPASKTLNRGISGDHIDGLVERLENSLRNSTPQRLFIMIGINDVGEQRGDDLINERYKQLYKKLLDRYPADSIFVHALLPVDQRYFPHKAGQILRINLFLEQLCRQHYLRFINMYALFCNDNGNLNEKYSYDGLHLNDAGYAMWAQQIKEFVK